MQPPALRVLHNFEEKNDSCVFFYVFFQRPEEEEKKHLQEQSKTGIFQCGLNNFSGVVYLQLIFRQI